MLQFELLKNHAGILLVGDYLTLRALHELVHEVNENSSIIQDKEGALLGLAYDIRKAYEGQRRILKSPEHYKEIGPRFGVEILWPVILYQSRQLRRAIAFKPSTRLDQALSYMLEHVVETAIEVAFKDQASAIQEAWERLDPVHADDDVKLHTRGAMFSSWSKSRRKRDLAVLLDSFSPMYPVTFEFRARGGEMHLIDPDEIEIWRDAEWPDPRW